MIWLLTDVIRDEIQMKEYLSLSWKEWLVFAVINVLVVPLIIHGLYYLLTVDKDLRLFWIALVAIVVIYTLSLLSFLYRRRIKALEKYGKREPSSKEAETLVKKLMFTTDKDLIQNNARFALLKVMAVVDTQGNCASKYHYVGTNISKNEALTEFMVRTANDSAVEFHKMRMSALDMVSNRPLVVQVTEDTLYYKKSRLLFANAVLPGQQFDIEWSFTWPNSLRKMGDCIGIDMCRYPHGVELLDIELIFEWELCGVVLLERRGKKQIACNKQIEHRKDSAGRNVYYCSIVDPHVDYYMFSYSAVQTDDVSI